MHLTRLTALGNRMSVVNPFEGRNPFSNCQACAIHVARVLVGGGNFAYVGDSTLEPRHFFAIEKEIPDDANREARAWRYIWKIAPGAVYILSDDNHTFNILRDYDGALHLIDSNMQVYRTLTSPSSCDVPTLDRESGEWYLRNYLGEGDNTLKILACGMLHVSFRELNADGRPRSASF
jgi:hypothetical protein